MVLTPTAEKRRAVVIWSLVLLLVGTIDVIVTTPPDALNIQVIHHTVISQTAQGAVIRDVPIYSQTVHDESAVARTQSLIAALPVRALLGYKCPAALVDHYSYEIQFSHFGIPVELASGGATGCEYWYVNGGVPHCCALAGFYAQLHDSTGAPEPEAFSHA